MGEEMEKVAKGMRNPGGSGLGGQFGAQPSPPP